MLKNYAFSRRYEDWKSNKIDMIKQFKHFIIIKTQKIQILKKHKVIN